VADALAGVDQKIARAKRKLANLDKTISRTFAPDRYRFVGPQFDPETAKHVYRVYDLPPVDPEWALEVGEVLYQLRSALDHLTWQLVKLDGGTPIGRAGSRAMTGARATAQGDQLDVRR
jgi:hypothetical protein